MGEERLGPEHEPGVLQVDTETGEVVDECRRCKLLEDQIAGLQRDVRGWATRYANLARDKEQEAREHPRWAEVKELFDYWRGKCHHPRARFNADRFYLAEPFLRKDGMEVCQRAINGAAFDAFSAQRKNGGTERYNGWELIFRDRGKFESFTRRAPHQPEPDEVHRLATQILEHMPEDDRETSDRILEAVGRAQAELRRMKVREEQYG